MEFTKRTLEGRTVVEMEGELSIYGARTVREELMALFDGGEGFSLDLTKVTQCDLAGVQLLLSAGIKAGRTGKAV